MTNFHQDLRNFYQKFEMPCVTLCVTDITRNIKMLLCCRQIFSAVCDMQEKARKEGILKPEADTAALKGDDHMTVREAFSSFW